MRIRFGLMFQETTYPEFVDGFEHSFSESSFLVWAEQQLGLEKTRPQEHLRIEQYRQILEAYVEVNPNAFFVQSFKADSFSTADLLLKMRDELLLTAWDFKAQEGMPLRLRQFVTIEQYAIGKLEAGFSERFLAIENALQTHTLPVAEIYLNEPLALMPLHWQRLFNQLQLQGVILEQIILQKQNSLSQKTDLDVFKARILNADNIENASAKAALKGDGSLLVLQANHDTDAAYFLAKFRRTNNDYAPVLLLDRQKSKTLDIAMIQEGLPSFGLQSISLARPMAQLLKLSTAFLWEPIDVYKILEFLSLPNKPIVASLARNLADAIAKRPGLFGALWTSTVARYFGKLRDDIKAKQALGESTFEEEKQLKLAESQYEFWFSKRQRHNRRHGVTVKECSQLFDYIYKWAAQEIDTVKERVRNYEEIITKQLYKDETDLMRLRSKIESQQQSQISLNALRIQAERLLQVMDVYSIKENARLSPLELERIMKALEEPAPLILRPKEVGYWHYFTHTSTVTESIDSLIWWNFVDTPRSALFSIWYPQERMYLDTLGYSLDAMDKKQALTIWQNKRTLAAVEKQLILVIPKTVEGQNTAPHPFWCDLEAIWGHDLKKIIYAIKPFVESSDNTLPNNTTTLGKYFKIPVYQQLQAVEKRTVESFLHLGEIAPETWHKEQESFTGLENLIYIPYQWAFESNIGLKRSSILSVTKENTIKGNLAHSMVQDLVQQIQEGKVKWEEEAIAEWFTNEFPIYLDYEGVTLQMFGKEADRTQYHNQLQYAIVQLMKYIKENGWSFLASEKNLQGEISKRKIVGIADLVLYRNVKGRNNYKEFCIVDLKWKSASRLETQMLSNEDLQLIIYSKLIYQTLEKEENPFEFNANDWAHTAFYSLKDAKFIARTNLAFRQAKIANSAINVKGSIPIDLDNLYVQQCVDIWKKIEHTYQWRIQQLEAGYLALNDNHNNVEEELPQVLTISAFTDFIETNDSKKHEYSIYKSLIN